MFKRESGIKRLLVSNIGVLLIIVFVFLCAFTPFDLSFLNIGPAMKGNTHGSNVALQLSVNYDSDVAKYIEILKEEGVIATFFFPEQYYLENSGVLKKVINSGNGAGYYVSGIRGNDKLSFYLGGGVSIPVMSYISGNGARQVCPSIDLSKLNAYYDWKQVLEEKLKADMFINVDADNNYEELKKIVQIIRDKGYTILKMDQML